MPIFVPAPRSLSLRELDVVECSLRSGLALGLEMDLRLMVTVRELQADLRRKASRMQGDVPEPGTVHAVVESRSAEDPTAIGRAR